MSLSSPAINTVIKMMESLPEDKQNELVEHLRKYIHRDYLFGTTCKAIAS